MKLDLGCADDTGGAAAGQRRRTLAFVRLVLKLLSRQQEIRIQPIRFFSISFLESSGIMPPLGAEKIWNLVDLEKGIGNREGANERDEKRTRVDFLSHR